MSRGFGNKVDGHMTPFGFQPNNPQRTIINNSTNSTIPNANPKRLIGNNINLINKKGPSFINPKEELKRLGYTNDEISRKSDDELMKMWWFLESQLYLELGDSTRKSFLDTIVDHYADIRPEYYIKPDYPGATKEYLEGAWRAKESAAYF